MRPKASSAGAPARIADEPIDECIGQRAGLGEPEPSHRPLDHRGHRRRPWCADTEPGIAVELLAQPAMGDAAVEEVRAHGGTDTKVRLLDSREQELVQRGRARSNSLKSCRIWSSVTVGVSICSGARVGPVMRSAQRTLRPPVGSAVRTAAASAARRPGRRAPQQAAKGGDLVIPLGMYAEFDRDGAQQDTEG